MGKTDRAIQLLKLDEIVYNLSFICKINRYSNKKSYLEMSFLLVFLGFSFNPNVSIISLLEILLNNVSY